MHIASLLVQALGFCMPRSTVSMSLAMDALHVKGSLLPSKLRSHLSSWQGAMRAIDSMHQSGSFLAETEDYQLKLPADEIVTLNKEIAQAVKNPSFDWIANGGEDLPAEVAAVLIGSDDSTDLE
jgi:hypothetical protein